MKNWKIFSGVQEKQTEEKEVWNLFFLTNFTVVVGIERFVNRIDDMLDFFHIASTQIFVTLKHFFFG